MSVEIEPFQCHKPSAFRPRVARPYFYEECAPVLFENRTESVDPRCNSVVTYKSDKSNAAR